MRRIRGFSVLLLAAALGGGLALIAAPLLAQVGPGVFAVALRPAAIAQYHLKVDNSTTPQRTNIGCETDQTGSATVNGLRIVGAAAGSPPLISAVACTGGDANIGISLRPLGTSGISIGASGTGMRQLVVYSQTLSPTANAANSPVGALIPFNQTFTVTGLAVADAIYLDSGNVAVTINCPHVAARVSATDTLQVTFGKFTTDLCTPATGIYHVVAVRT